MLSFLSPLFLVGAAAAGLPILLHLLKREPEIRVQFPAVKLLMRAPVELTERRRLRELLLLALRVTALVLLALAFGRPFFASGAAIGTAGATVVALDTSYSMSAPGRFERARQLAKNAVAAAPAGDLVGVVTFADAAEIAEKPTGDRRLASAAIERASPGYGSTRYRAGLSAAAEILDGRRGTIVVVTDLQENGWDAGDRATVPDSARIEVADVGALPADLAVTGVRVLTDRVIATVRNTGERTVDARVHLTLDGRTAGSTAVPVGPRNAADVSLPISGHPSTVSVAVEDREGLQANNERYAVVGETDRPSVLVVSGNGDLEREAFYLNAALAAGAPGGGYEVTGIGGAALGNAGSDRLATYSAVVLVSTRGVEHRGREMLARYVKDGGGLLIAAGPEIDGDVVSEVPGDVKLRVSAVDAKPAPRTLAAADRRHPVFARFGADVPTLTLVTFQMVSRISGDSCQTVARFTSGEAALIDCVSGDGRVLVLASDLNNAWNNFPLHSTFVPFVHEAIRYASSARPRAGEHLVGDVPPGVPARPGIATLTDAGGRVRRIAVNVDPRESDPSRISADEFQSAVTRLKEAGASRARLEARQQEEQQHLWQYAIIAMLLALAAEGFLASRTA
jgi:hypothetical protein